MQEASCHAGCALGLAGIVIDLEEGRDRFRQCPLSSTALTRTAVGAIACHRYRILGPFIALLLACAFFASQSDRFLSGQNFSLILQQVMVVGVIAIGQTLIILTAGIDLSCGMIMALGSIVMTKFAVDLRHESVPGDRLRIACLYAVRLHQWRAYYLHQTAAVHRHARHAQHRVRDHANLFRSANRLGSARNRFCFFGNTFKMGNTAITYGIGADAGTIFYYLVLSCARPRRDATSTP